MCPRFQKYQVYLVKNNNSLFENWNEQYQILDIRETSNDDSHEWEAILFKSKWKKTPKKYQKINIENGKIVLHKKGEKYSFVEYLHVILRYEDNFDGKKLLKDIKKLFKLSRVGQLCLSIP